MAGITSREPQKLPQRTTPVRASFTCAEMGQRVVVTTGVGRSCPHVGRAERQVHVTGGSFSKGTVLELRALSRYLAAQADWLEGIQ